MWKSYNRFYTQTIRSEVGSVFLCKNVNEIPYVKKISLTSVSSSPNNIRNVLMTLSSLQLVSNRKTKIVTSKRSNSLMKIWKGQPLGAKTFLTGGRGLQFLSFFTLKLMPGLDLTSLLFYHSGNSDFKFFIKSSSIFSELRHFFQFFQFLPPIQVIFTLKQPSNAKQIFFWRFLKLPVSSFRKDN